MENIKILALASFMIISSFAVAQNNNYDDQNNDQKYMKIGIKGRIKFFKRI